MTATLFKLLFIIIPLIGLVSQFRKAGSAMKNIDNKYRIPFIVWQILPLLAIIIFWIYLFTGNLRVMVGFTGILFLMGLVFLVVPIKMLRAFFRAVSKELPKWTFSKSIDSYSPLPLLMKSGGMLMMLLSAVFCYMLLRSY